MNRMEEYRNLMQELDTTIPNLENSLKKAQIRLRRRRYMLRSVSGLTASFAIFVLLVNFWIPAAYACSKVPFLRELTKAVTFSRSLTDAVDHDYVQPLHLWQTDGDVTATVEYLIVDQKQLNIFYRLDSENYTHMSEHPRILDAEGSAPPSCSYYLNSRDVPNGELRSLTVDFVEGNVPDTLRLTLDVMDNGDPDYIAHFDFLLEFDPDFTAAGKYLELNQTIELDGQSITLTDLEIYPTHLRLNVADHPENTAWLKRLDFYVETDWGMRFDPVENGITATGMVDSPMMTSYRADSSYFYEAKHLNIVITGAEWLRKDMEKIYLNLRTGESDPLPEDVELGSIAPKANGWLLDFKARQREENHTHQIFDSKYYDAEGMEYHIDSWTSGSVETNEQGAWFHESFPLRNYPYDEVWLCPLFSHEWSAEEPIIIPIQ